MRWTNYSEFIDFEDFCSRHSSYQCDSIVIVYTHDTNYKYQTNKSGNINVSVIKWREKQRVQCIARFAISENISFQFIFFIRFIPAAHFNPIPPVYGWERLHTHKRFMRYFTNHLSTTSALASSSTSIVLILECAHDEILFGRDFSLTHCGCFPFTTIFVAQMSTHRFDFKQ